MPASRKSALIFSDSHLAPGAWVSREPVKGDSYFAFEQIVDLAIKHSVILIGAGDLIDTKRPDSATIEVLRKGCEKLEEARIPFYYIMGQHDLTNPPWFSAVHYWPTLIRPGDSFMDKTEMLSFGGFSWLPSDQVNEQLAKTDSYILILHQVWEEFMGGGQVLCDGSLVHTPDRTDLVFTGDYHVHKSLVKSNLNGHPFKIYSPGSTCLQSIDEPRDKSVYLLHNDLTVKSIPLLCRPTLHVEQILASEVQVDEFCDTIAQRILTCKQEAAKAKIPEHLCEPLISLRYLPDVTNIVPRLRKAVPSVQHLFMKPAFVESEERIARKVTRARVLECGLEGAVAALTVDDKELQAACTRLLAADDPVVELQTLKDEFFKKDA